ncbi:SulP family inorganic anion transporter [Defluviimonas sp. WL0024]|uniref:SulP family inorganic anion transporter n=1 Tax=Albidovulum salinarum TaxID=2984153 RepID=A0ABT2XC32_9RHOB|nr:SulP family inorganic anion transporter [Defluviimonas sp. WL0024]MCU9849250.1 SulP family inorganic anion transporter [Defluviimonas sp. WL0024]
MTRLAIARPALLGFALGVDALGHCVAIGAFVFAGPLASGVGIGTTLFLVSTLVATMAIARWGGLQGALGIAQDSSIAILAAVTAAAAAAIAGAGNNPLPTALTLIGLSTLLSGAVLFGMGKFGAGRIVRMLPYPVALGFLASSGWLLTRAALMIVANADDLLGLPHAMWTNLVITLPAVTFAVSMMLSLRLWTGAATMMIVLTVFIAGFYLTLAFLGMDVDAARQMGLLPSITSSGDRAGPDPAFLAQIDWSQILNAGPSLAVVVAINVIAFLLNTSGTELATRSNLDMNRELRVGGLTNATLGLFGGVTSFVSTGSTIFADKLGARGRAMTLAYCAVVLAGGVFAAQVVAAVPVFVTGGLLLFIGLSMLEDWMIAPRRHLTLQDWLTVVAIVAVTATTGLFLGILAGILFALISFVLSYVRIPIIRRNIATQPRRSNVDRSPDREACLRDTWNRVRLARLQGYLFFGSVDRLLEEVYARRVDASGAGTENRPDWLILDFSAVTGMDSSACAGLGKLGYLAPSRRLRVHLCGLSTEVKTALELWRNDFDEAFGFGRSDTLESALEQVEEALLAECPISDAQGGGLEKLLRAAAGAHPRMPELAGLFEVRMLNKGEVLFRQGSDGRDIFVVEEGRLGVYLDRGEDGAMRVRVLTEGAMVGEIARYLHTARGASVVADGPVVVQCLSAATLDRLERDDRDLAAILHATIARELAEKVTRTNLLLLDD